MASKARRRGMHNKGMLKEYGKHVYDAWLRSDSGKLCLPQTPSTPWVNASSHEDVYLKTRVFAESVAPNKLPEHYVTFVQKNDKPHGFTWTTNAEKLCQGVRWGIIPAESVTGKVIGALGQYRIAEHKRVIKGMISNRHRAKMALLDHYQDRFEALQALESLVNKNDINTLQTDFREAFRNYVNRLNEIKNNIKDLPSDVEKKLRNDIEEDIANAQDYYDQVYLAHENSDAEALKAFNRSRGNDSILEFVKRQMTYNLYEMQGINQDITYGKGRDFALTRGVLNDCIEDARKAIDDHRADPRNLVLPEHHACFAGDNEKVTYNFKHDHLTPEREKEVLIGISFIEKWDEVVYKDGRPMLRVMNGGSKIDIEQEVKRELERPLFSNLSEDVKKTYADQYRDVLMMTARRQRENNMLPLVEIAATNWRASVSFAVFLKKIGWAVANAFMSIIGRTQTLDENAWQEKDKSGKYKFKSFASELYRSPYVRTYNDQDPWYIKAIKLIVPKRSGFDPADPWYLKIKKTILGNEVYQSSDSLFSKIAKVFSRLKHVAFNEAVQYRGARPNDSLWWKLFSFVKIFLTAGRSVLFGFKDFFEQLFVKLWRIDIYYDYKSAKPLPSLQDVQASAQAQIDDIEHDFALYLNGYELCFMPSDSEQALEPNKIYLTEKMSQDKKRVWLEYKLLGPYGVVTSGVLTSTDLGGHIWDFPTNGKVEDLREAFKSILPTMVDVLHARGAAQACYGVNQLIAEAHANDASPFQMYKLDKADAYKPLTKNAQIPYRLVPGDQNDILTAMVRGVDGFASIFTHGFGKDPVGALAFGVAYTFVGGSILMPDKFAFLGTAFQKWAVDLGLSVASGGTSSAVAASALVGQWASGVVDVIEHGPQSGLVKTLTMVLDDPLTLAAGVGAAWLAGHVLTVTVPFVRHDLGTNEDIGKLTFGGKGAVALHEALHKAQQNPGKPIKFMVDDVELLLNVRPLTPEEKLQNDRFRFVAWLVERQAMLPRLSEGVRHQLARQVDEMFEFDSDRATALKKLIFPERSYSIAHQLVTIPLSYIPAVIRALASVVSSAVTGSMKPMEIAWSALGKKMLKDLSRLITVAEGVFHLLGNVISVAAKVPVLLLNMSLSRLAAKIGYDLGHSLYKLMAPFHIALRKIGEMLYPVTVGKAMADEHPRSALEREQFTQKDLYKALGVDVNKPVYAPVKSVVPAAVPIVIKDEEDNDIGAGVGLTSSDQAPSAFLSNRR